MICRCTTTAKRCARPRASSPSKKKSTKRKAEIYRHRQVGRIILASLLLPALIIGGIALAAQNSFLLVVLLPLLLIAPVFSSLTVVVDDKAVTVSFGVGLIHRRIVLREIQSAVPVRTSWMSGWGIRFIPGGRLYNVSGFDAVELRLTDGQIVQIGTDDQQGLLAALHAATTVNASGTFAEVAPSRSTMAWVAVPIAGVVAIALGMVVFAARQPVTVTHTAEALDVSGAGYHAHVVAGDIVSVRLDDVLPAIRYRSNGFAANGRLRGHFRLADGRAAQLFVRRDRPPFLIVETRAGQPVIFNTDDPQQTRALYAQLAR